MKQKTRTRVLSWLLSLVMILSLVPGMSITAYAAGDSYVDGSGESKTVDATELEAATTSWTDGSWYIVPAGGLTISGRITVNGTVNLILRDGATLTASAGITTTDATLNIYAQSAGTGALIATCSKAGKESGGSAGIGGGGGGNSANGGAGGTVNIYGGTVTATGGDGGRNGGGGAGIGGGSGGKSANGGAGGNVNIYGGTVTATGGKGNGNGGGGAGIGGGGGGYKANGGAGGNVNIYGGTVTATGGNGGGNGGGSAGIGGGGAGIDANGGAGGTVNIYGGTVTATGSNGDGVSGGGAGIGGGGGSQNANCGAGGNVNIYGGTVTAKGGNGDADFGTANGAGIGDGGKGYNGKAASTAGTLTLGMGVKLYNGTDNTGDVLDESDSTERTYSGSRPKNIFAEYVSSHTHSFTYTASGATITATCSAEDCPLEGKTATLTIAAPQHTAVGDGKSADAQITDANRIKGGAAVRYYATDASSNKTGDALTSAPTDAGTYWAEITLTNGGSGANDSATAHVVYSITNPDYNVTLPTDLVGGTVTADKTSAKFGEVVTLTITPNNGFNIKTVKYNDTAITENGGVYSFTMPASDVTVSAEFEGNPFGITTEVSPANGGAVTVSGTGVENPQTGTTAKAGSTVTLTVNAYTGFTLENVTVKKANGDTVTVTDNKFTMPTEAVTVSATFAGKETTATLNVTGNEGTTCTAKLLNSAYEEIESVTKKGGEPFILLVNRDEDYDFNVTYGADSPVILTEFTKEEYESYVAYAKDNNITLSSNMVLAWVTMPGVADNSVTLTVDFSKLQTFTVLYQPSDSGTTAVWCKFAKTEGGNTVTASSQMKSDATMGDGSQVYSLKVTAAFNPEKVAFVTDESNLESATMVNATVSQDINSWINIDGGKYLVIGGNAKTVVAAFVTDENAIPFYNKADRGGEPKQYGAGVTYRLAVAVNGNPGTVTAPAAPKPSEIGTVFAGWSALVGTAPNKTEIKCAAGDPVQITENTSFNATWEPIQLTVTLNLNGGKGVSDKVTVNYKDKLPTLAPTKDSFAFDGWTVDKTVIEGRYLYLKGSTFIPDTTITSNMGLTAEWKHVHTYTCYRLQEVGLQWFYDDNAVHVAFCSCYDYKLMAHEYDSDGMCACGKHKPEAGKVQLDVTYEQLENGKYTVKFKDKTRMEPQGKYVTLSASNLWGSDWSFTKWQYSTDEGNTWKDLAVTTSVKFGVMCNMRVRAVYEESADAKPQVELNASKYDDHFEHNGTSLPMDNIAFQMSYKLPADCTFVDAGLRFGDNDGIGYYDIKERTVELSAGQNAANWIGGFATSLLTFSTPEWTDSSYTERYYELRKNNALDEMSATELAKYIYEGKTTKAKVDPIYWDSKVKTEGNRGAIATRAPLNMTNAEDGNNWIYGIAWMRYKDKDGNIQTIYTEALATTLNDIVQRGSQSVTNTAAN